MKLLLLVFIYAYDSLAFSYDLSNLNSQFEACIEQIQTEQSVPGIAIGVVDKSGLVYFKGFGFRDLEKKLPVTAR